GWVSIRWKSRVRDQWNSTVIGIRTLSSLTWRCSEEGWKIVREHNSSQRLARDAVDPALASASKER
ncbi:hypothetical protein, partial [Hydrogenophaga intermedia]